jgi:hypothetical protein
MADDDGLNGRRVRSRDIPELLELLACGDPKAQAETLTLLCPCRNVRYDKEVWAAIFHASRCGVDGTVRDKAEHAIGTLRERARTDPRSQALVGWLVEQGVAPPLLEDAIPAWRPRPSADLNGIAIPPYERPARSPHKRQRR